MFKEPDLINLIKTMAALYSESYPDDQESIQRFLTWILQQWGYKNGNS